LIVAAIAGCNTRDDSWHLKAASGPIQIPSAQNIESVEVALWREGTTFHSVLPNRAAILLDIVKDNAPSPAMSGRGPLPQFGGPTWVLKITIKSGEQMYISIYGDGSGLSLLSGPFALPTHNGDTYRLTSTRCDELKMELEKALAE
jgi:hypothetical protein